MTTTPIDFYVAFDFDEFDENSNAGVMREEVLRLLETVLRQAFPASAFGYNRIVFVLAEES